jgi:hypothetical protein
VRFSLFFSTTWGMGSMRDGFLKRPIGLAQPCKSIGGTIEACLLPKILSSECFWPIKGISNKIDPLVQLKPHLKSGNCSQHTMAAPVIFDDFWMHMKLLIPPVD